MSTILSFLTAIVFVAKSFQNYMIQRLHKLYDHYSYAATVKDNEEGESDYCSVCLCQIYKGEKVRSLPVCKHRYHADCIGAWLKNHPTCPLCRNKITDHIPHNQLKQVKNLRESMINLVQSLSDLLVTLFYLTLPSSTTESFPLIR
ncbi:E3 ubiquitin-protein ligase RNF181-like [Abrus precatorius]|uniref:RING-type E3 ubiquitin transferase n=1 Tax=Abrus precatorius TaxID=3816 RepID=A0A8B8K0W8_ABRPR|nr:E3 ubiquitin-protein ligase RNF181-like [Abrus precatorius]